MKTATSIQYFSRAFIVIMTLIILVGGITFAALQSQFAIVQGNTIRTATADLKISTDDINFSRSVMGFTFDGIVPGGQPGPDAGHSVQLRNDGNTDLALRLTVNTSLSNPDNVQLDKVKIIITPITGQLSIFTLQQLMDASAGGGLLVAGIGPLPPTGKTNIKMQVQLDEDAISGSSAAIDNLNFVFDAVAAQA